MVSGWRRAFCTSISKEKSETSSASSTTKTEKRQSSGNSPRISSKLGFFSNPSTPHLPTPTLRCRTTTITTTTTTVVTNTTPTSSLSLPNSPKAQSSKTATTPTKKSNGPWQLFQYLSSSPRSPSTFSLLKSNLHLSRSRCGICMHSVKSGQGTAIFTAECSHVFHFPCVAAQVKNRSPNNNVFLDCPVCGSKWSEPPLLSSTTTTTPTNQTASPGRDRRDDQNQNQNQMKKNQKHLNLHLRVYDDDEPLTSPSPASLFVPIPESEEEENDTQLLDNDNQEFQGFFANPKPHPSPPLIKVKTTPEVVILPESAVVSAGRSHETRVVVLKVRAPLVPSPSRPRGVRSGPSIDLVALLDVSEHMSGGKLKRAMGLIISSLGPTDRLSIVVFSSTSKRLLPLRRMTPTGKRSARRILDTLAVVNGSHGMSVDDALKKAAKVIHDRTDKNPHPSVVVISSNSSRSSSTVVSTTRSFSPLEEIIPVRFISLAGSDSDALSKCVSAVLTVMFYDVELQLGFSPGSAPAKISAVYPLTGRIGVFGPGSVRVGDLHPGEERDFLVELKVPVSHCGSPHVLSVRPFFKEPSMQEAVACNEHSFLLPRPLSVRSSVTGIQRLRNVHITTRAVAESRRLLERAGDVSGAYHLLTSARALLMQSADDSSGDCLRGLEAELAELHRHSRQNYPAGQERRQMRQPSAVDEKLEVLTPTSAWRAAERLAKVAIMRKHMNRVSDLHGFENARF